MNNNLTTGESSIVMGETSNSIMSDQTTDQRRLGTNVNQTPYTDNNFSKDCFIYSLREYKNLKFETNKILKKSFPLTYSHHNLKDNHPKRIMTTSIILRLDSSVLRRMYEKESKELSYIDKILVDQRSKSTLRYALFLPIWIAIDAIKCSLVPLFGFCLLFRRNSQHEDPFENLVFEQMSKFFKERVDYSWFIGKKFGTIRNLATLSKLLEFYNNPDFEALKRQVDTFKESCVNTGEQSLTDLRRTIQNNSIVISDNEISEFMETRRLCKDDLYKRMYNNQMYGYSTERSPLYHMQKFIQPDIKLMRFLP